MYHVAQMHYSKVIELFFVFIRDNFSFFLIVEEGTECKKSLLLSTF